MPELAERVCVVGSSGAGKTTLARALERLGYARLELDALHHQAGWTRAPDAEVDANIAAFLRRHPRWVADGNYAAHRERLWQSADALVWLDLPRGVVLRQVIRRTMKRAITRETLWNGNREPWSNLLSLDPERSVIAWSWTHHASYRAEFEAAMADPLWAHLTWHRLCRRREVKAWLERARGLGGAPRGP
ncbi:MAG: AAA family ATPase [Myxococcota bacterium]